MTGVQTCALPIYTATSLAYGGPSPSGTNLTNLKAAWPVAGYYISSGGSYRGVQRNAIMLKRDENNLDFKLSSYKYINFVMYSDKATNDTISVTLGNTEGTTHTKKFTSTDAFSINWEGKWKTISVPVSSFTAESGTTYDITDSSQNAANYFILTNANPSADTTLYLHEVYMSVDDMSDPAVTTTTYGVPSCSDTAVTTTVINKSDEPISCVLVAAVYSAVNGPLETVDFEEVTIQPGVEKGITVPVVSESGQIVKGFLWESGTLKPLVANESYTVE